MKDELSKSDLDNWIGFLKNTILDLRLCSANVQKIIDVTRSEESHKIKNIEPFLGHYVYLCYSHCALSISKLFGENEKRSFVKYFNKLEHFQFNADLQKIVEDNSLDVKSILADCRYEINAKKLIIKKFKDRRDTFYAHSDPNKKVEVETLSEIDELAKLAEHLFNSIYSKLYDKTFLFQILYWEIDPLIQCRINEYNYYEKLENEL